MLEAYSDRAGVNRRFAKHGLERANEILGIDAFELDKCDVVGNWDQAAGCHNRFYLPKEDLCSAGVAFPAGRRILGVQSHKYGAADRETLCRAADCEVVNLWSASEQYRICYFCSLPAGRRD